VRIMEYMALFKEFESITFLNDEQKDLIVRSEMSSFAQIRKERSDKSIDDVLLRVNSQGDIDQVFDHYGNLVLTVRLFVPAVEIHVR
jgi:hypothetical protein